MSSIRIVTDDMAKQITAYLAPYQPSIPPNYVNNATTAGTILPTLCSAGYPIQQHVMKRLENKMAQVAVVADKNGGKEYPFLSRSPSEVIYNSQPAGDAPLGIEYLEVARIIRRICMQIWAPDDIDRDMIGRLITQQTGEVVRLNHSLDQTVSLWKRDKESDEDFEQADSVYVRNIWWEVDYTETMPVEVAKVTQTVTNLTPVVTDWTTVPPPLTVDTL